MYQTLPIRITSTSDQKELLWILSEKFRLLYNFALAERRDATGTTPREATVNSRRIYQQSRNSIQNISGCIPRYCSLY